MKLEDSIWKLFVGIQIAALFDAFVISKQFPEGVVLCLWVIAIICDLIVIICELLEFIERKLEST